MAGGNAFRVIIENAAAGIRQDIMEDIRQDLQECLHTCCRMHSPVAAGSHVLIVAVVKHRQSIGAVDGKFIVDGYEGLGERTGLCIAGEDVHVVAEDLHSHVTGVIGKQLSADVVLRLQRNGGTLPDNMFKRVLDVTSNLHGISAKFQTAILTDGKVSSHADLHPVEYVVLIPEFSCNHILSYF